MKLFLDTNVSSLDAPAGEEGPKVPEIKDLQYETFSLPIEARILLEQAPKSLSELQQRVVYLFFYEDLSQTEVGRRLGRPQRKVSRTLALATNPSETNSGGAGRPLFVEWRIRTGSVPTRIRR